VSSSSFATAPVLSDAALPVAYEAHEGLTSTPRTLSPWLFYDEAGSQLFEQITQLPEYYLTRTERSLFLAHADEILSSLGSSLTIAELGAGSAAKTGTLLKALTSLQEFVLYQPIDISPTALDEARESLERDIPRCTVAPQVANYITESFAIHRPAGCRVLALYIGSSIGNFSPSEAREILANLADQLEPGDALLLGTDLAPGPNKSVERLIAAYNDAAGVTAAFNRNILTRLNRDLGANFQPGKFRHRALWNAAASRIEMHLESIVSQNVYIPANAASPALDLHFEAGETIHTENSYKFTPASIDELLEDSGFAATKVFTDPDNLFAVTLANVI